MTPDFDPIDVKACCAQYGGFLDVPDGIDGCTLMAAIASNESSYGVNCGPRHEPAYDVGGGVWTHNAEQRALVEKYGPDGASSFGPWQLMLINCGGREPDVLLEELDENAKAFVAYFNSYEVSKHPHTLAEIGEIYNLGHIGPDPAYVTKLCTAYASNPLHRLETAA